MNELKRRVQKALRNRTKIFFVRVCVWAGFKPFNKAETAEFLLPYRIAAESGAPAVLPEVLDLADASKQIFDCREVLSEARYVWQYRPLDSGKTMLLPSGGLLHNRRVLHTDFDTFELLRDLVRPERRSVEMVGTLLAPISHQFDGLYFAGYYDYMFLVVAKLCRFKETLSEAVFAEAAVAYPLLGTEYERELLERIGIQSDRIFDSRETNIRFQRCILGNKDSWFHPHAGDIAALRKYVGGDVAAEQTGRYRMYIRRGGRRRILQEDALIAMLMRLGFRIIDDVPRSVAEQVTLYHGASFIVGPHGASFTNILWCVPGTHLVELFNPHFTPDAFQYLAVQLGLRYSAYHQGDPEPTGFQAVANDISVSVTDLEVWLVKQLANEAPVT